MKKAWKALASVALGLALVCAPLVTAGAIAVEEEYPPPPPTVIVEPTPEPTPVDEAEEPLTGSLSETGENAQMVGLLAGVGIILIGGAVATAAFLYRRAHT